MLPKPILKKIIREFDTRGEFVSELVFNKIIEYSSKFTLSVEKDQILKDFFHNCLEPSKSFDSLVEFFKGHGKETKKEEEEDEEESEENESDNDSDYVDESTKNKRTINTSQRKSKRIKK